MRLHELLTEREMTVYALAKEVGKRGVSEQAVYRLARVKGAPKRMDVKLLCALYDVFGCEDFNELLTLEPVGTYAPYTPPAPRRRHRNRAA